MDFDFDKCPSCGYINRNRPNVCPSCGHNLLEYRNKLNEELRKQQEAEEEKMQAIETENKYVAALKLFTDGKYADAISEFKSLGDYKESKEYIDKCEDGLFQEIVNEFNNVELLRAIYNNKGSGSFANDIKTDNSQGINVEEIKSFEYEITEEEYKKYESILANSSSNVINELIKKFETKNYNESKVYINVCNYAKALIAENSKRVSLKNAIEKYDESIKIFNLAKSSKDYDFKLKKYNEAYIGFNSIINYKDSKQKAEECRKCYTDLRNKNDKKESRMNVLQIIFCFSPILATVIFAIVLFPNITQMNVKGGATIGWIMLFIIFALASILVPLFIMSKRKDDWLGDEPKKKISSFALLGFSIVSILYLLIFFIVNYPFGFNPASNIKLTATLSDGNTIYFVLENDNDVKVNYISGSMVFYNASGKTASYTVNFNGDYEKETKKNTSVEFSGNSLTNLGRISHIEYTISVMGFRDEYKTYDNYTYKVIVDTSNFDQ